MKYIDIHCHLDFPDYDSDREEILAKMKEKEIGAITIGADLESSKRAVKIAEQNENIWATIGIHPEDQNLFDEKEFEKLVISPKVVGIGECGLDYFAPRSLSGAISEVGFSDKAMQKTLFESQIQFAIKHNKPLMLHCRDAYDDTLEILGNYKKAGGLEAAKLKGNIHFFAGDVSVAKKFLDLGFTMSFTGVITFARNYDEVIKYIPQDSIMSETDSPVMGAPVPYRGQKNSPLYIPEIVKKMAEIRGEDMNTLNNAIINNTKRVFGIGDIMYP